MMNKPTRRRMSVIIPVYNDAPGLADTVDSLLAQDYPADGYEIIIADNNSTDGTTDLARRYVEEHPGRVKLVVEEKVQSSYAARNRGVRAAGGELLGFIDADMWVGNDYVARVDEVFRDPETAYLGCNVKMVTDSDGIIQKFHFHTGFPIREYIEKAHFSGTGALVVRKEVFDRVGLFDLRLVSGGDNEFGNRVFDAGYRLRYADHIVLCHPTYNTFRKTLKKYFRMGRGFHQLFRYYPTRYRRFRRKLYNPRIYLPPNFFKLRKYFFQNGFDRQERWRLLLIMGACKMAQNYGYLYEKLLGNRQAATRED